MEAQPLIATPRLWMTRDFFGDVQDLPPEVRPKIRKVMDSVRAFGVNHPPLRTRPIKGNPNPNFKLMDVDDKYRIVAVVEGREPLFMRAGNHDETIQWGENASLSQFVERLEVTSETFRRREVRRVIEGQPTLIETGTSLPEILEHAEELSDLVSSDVFGFLDGYADGLIEDWMIFLSPLQTRAVQRSIDGPARVSGGPGTGKTVVGLHRAARYARSAGVGDRVLMTSFVSTVPKVLDGLFERLAPDVKNRVEFVHIHSLAGSIAGSRVRARVDNDAARARFDERMAADVDRRKRLVSAGFAGDYLWDEVTRVLEGREVPDLAAYLSLERHGRMQPMSAAVRRDVWAMYSEYLEACERGQPPIATSSRHLTLARRSIEGVPVSRPYSAIIVDEAQDLTEAGIRFLLKLLSGGASGSLLLIGDNAQRIYHGGFRLRELGLEIRGCSFVLDTCYRSTHEIMAAANALGRYLSMEEFGEGPGATNTGWTTSRYGPRPTLREFASVDEEHRWLAGELRNLSDADRDMSAVLVPTNNLAKSWRAYLDDQGVVTCDLRSYTGRPVAGVKVGTHNLAKGLEFARVFVPNLSRYGVGGRADEADDLILRGSKLYVAMTRARDQLHLSYAAPSSLFVEPLLDHVEIVPTDRIS